MSGATFDTPDYLCVGPGAWGRAKSAKDAFRLMRTNCAGHFMDDRNRASIFRIADCVDRIAVDDGGGITVKSFKGEKPEGLKFDDMLPLVLLVPVTVPMARIAAEYGVR